MQIRKKYKLYKSLIIYAIVINYGCLFEFVVYVYHKFNSSHRYKNHIVLNFVHYKTKSKVIWLYVCRTVNQGVPNHSVR